jgi:VCBS repeat-containing protein
MNFDTAAASAPGNITGKNKASVIEDGKTFAASVASGELDVKGTTDDSFQSFSQSGIYGTFRMGVEDNGRWVYVLDNSLATTQALAKGGRALETFVVQTTGGTLSETITILIRGADEAAPAGAAQARDLFPHSDDLADFIELIGLPQS